MSDLESVSSSDIKPSSPFKQAVVESALWAAAGDALGWITELARGSAGVKNRIGSTTVKEPVAWQRIIGGRNGPKVTLPMGTYSDDTQLRLAVSRSIRGNGIFDVETFAKIELPVWPTYALGAGLGTKAAALNLSRRGVNWFSNFYERGTQKYINGGGNGAAMRVQPHVWSSRGDEDEMLLNVFRDSIVTHGHPQGFCGALFHALALRETLQEGTVPGPESWKRFALRFLSVPELVQKDNQLDTFWRATWESESKTSLEDAMSKAFNDASKDIQQVIDTIQGPSIDTYHDAIGSIGCLTERFRGAGFKTALAACALSYIYRDEPIEGTLALAANELESDTDTIATMAGALLGSVAGRAPSWLIQDSEYIKSEAERLADIALGHTQSSFSYPDIGRWNPPTNQGASIKMHRGSWAIVGLGIINSHGNEFRSGDAAWQWFTLPFGQTILAKRKIDITDEVSADQLPKLDVQSIQSTHPRKPHAIQHERHEKLQSEISFSSEVNKSIIDQTSEADELLDSDTDTVIASGFDNETLGRLLNRAIDSSLSIEVAVSFAAIIAKAKIKRIKRGK